MTVDWELDHVGIVVRDIEKAIKHYHRLGIELLVPPEPKTFEDSLHKLQGETPSEAPVSVRTGFVQNRSIRIKLVQPVSANGLFHEYLERNGEGMNHIEFRVNDLPKEKARLAEIGIPVIASTKRPDGSDMEIFFDTGRYGNVSIALFSEPAPFPIFHPSPGSWRFHHLGFVVKDIHGFADFYQSIGFKLLAPPVERGPTEAVLQRWKIHGKVPAGPISSRECRLQNRQGSFLLGVDEPVEGKDLYREFLDEHGEGVQHIHFLVDNLPEELARMTSNGFPVLMTQKRPDGTLQESYYDTRKVGNVIIALWGGPPPFKAIPE